MATKLVSVQIKCVHCNDKCIGEFPTIDSKSFCCKGCQIMYQLLHENGLESFYALAPSPGSSFKSRNEQDYSFLDNKDVQSKLISFSANHIHTIYLELPQIHCVACVWLLENLSRLNKGVKESQVNFLQKECTIVFDDRYTSLKKVVLDLDKIGYAPILNLDIKNSNHKPSTDKSLIYKIGITGFCFGNIMLLSLPNYLGLDAGSFNNYFGILKLLLALPVVFYSASNYFSTAWQSLKLNHVGLDIPIVLGILTLLFRSIFEVISRTGDGYFDSLAGFVLFLLIGKWFQSKSFQSISFERDYLSFFPISIKVKINELWEDMTIDKLQISDCILVRYGEVIPCDGIILKGQTKIDYSFVTGESKFIEAHVGDDISAGGKVMGSPIEVKLLQPVKQGKLTKLWNEDIFNKRHVERENLVLNLIGKYFTITIITIAFLTLAWWYRIDAHRAINSFTSVLIISCPCVLALSVPFIYGNALRLLSKYNIYCKSVFTLFDLSSINAIVFDKTGTLTDCKNMKAKYYGVELTDNEKDIVKSLCFYSNHVLSKGIANDLRFATQLEIDNYKEIPGKGLMGIWNNTSIRIGSQQFIFNSTVSNKEQSVFIEINGVLKGHYTFENSFRPHLKKTIKYLSKEKQLSVLSGDNSLEQERIKSVFPTGADIRFNQSPMDKLNYINACKSSGCNVMMVGDGLNDAGALKSSNVGVVMSSKENNFTPSADVIMSSSHFSQIPLLLKYADDLNLAMNGAFVLALLYNLIGLGFAVTGNLTPIVAAILMPISSLSIMAYGITISSALLPATIKSQRAIS